MLMNCTNKQQIDMLISDTILPALLHDFEWSNQAELNVGIKYCCQQLEVETSELLSPDENEDENEYYLSDDTDDDTEQKY